MFFVILILKSKFRTLPNTFQEMFGRFERLKANHIKQKTLMDFNPSQTSQLTSLRLEWQLRCIFCQDMGAQRQDLSKVPSKSSLHIDLHVWRKSEMTIQRERLRFPKSWVCIHSWYWAFDTSDKPLEFVPRYTWNILKQFSSRFSTEIATQDTIRASKNWAKPLFSLQISHPHHPWVKYSHLDQGIPNTLLLEGWKDFLCTQKCRNW